MNGIAVVESVLLVSAGAMFVAALRVKGEEIERVEPDAEALADARHIAWVASLRDTAPAPRLAFIPAQRDRSGA